MARNRNNRKNPIKEEEKEVQHETVEEVKEEQHVQPETKEDSETVEEVKEEQPQESKEEDSEGSDEESKEESGESEEPQESKEEEKVEPIKGETHAIRKENGEMVLEEGIFTKDKIQKLLSQPGVSVEEKLRIIHTQAVPQYSTLVGKVLGYTETMDGSVYIETNIGASKNFDLYNTIKNVLKEADYNEFKLKFDIINLMFREHGKGALSDQALNRFVEGWKWSDSSLRGYQTLIIVITALCDISKRENEKKLINFDNIEEGFKGSDIKSQLVDNLKKYYK